MYLYEMNVITKGFLNIEDTRTKTSSKKKNDDLNHKAVFRQIPLEICNFL